MSKSEEVNSPSAISSKWINYDTVVVHSHALSMSVKKSLRESLGEKDDSAATSDDKAFFTTPGLNCYSKNTLADLRTFACPFNKYDPERYSARNKIELQYGGCESVSLNNIAQVKLHIARVHTKPEFYCSICFSVLYSVASLDEHRFVFSCDAGPCPFAEKLDRGKLQAIMIKWPEDTPRTNWYRIYTTIFPDAHIPQDPYLHWKVDLNDDRQAVWRNDTFRFAKETVRELRDIISFDQFQEDTIHELIQTSADELVSCLLRDQSHDSQLLTRSMSEPPPGSSGLNIHFKFPFEPGPRQKDNVSVNIKSPAATSATPKAGEGVKDEGTNKASPSRYKRRRRRFVSRIIPLPSPPPLQPSSSSLLSPPIVLPPPTSLNVSSTEDDVYCTPQSDGEMSFMGLASPECIDEMEIRRVVPRIVWEEIKQVLVINYFKFLKGMNGSYRACPSGGSLTQPENQRQVPTSPEVHSESAQISKRRCKREDREDGEDEDKRNRKKPKMATHQPSNDTRRRVLACPYAKHDHARYSEQNTLIRELGYRGCSSVYAPDIPRLKQHLYRVHKRPENYCDFCFKIFDENDWEGRDSHVRSISCVQRDISECPFREKMNRGQFRRIKARNLEGLHAQASPVENWRQIFTILFPDDPIPDCPYSDGVWGHEVDGFLEYAATEGPRIYNEIFTRRLSENIILPAWERLELSTLLEEAIGELVDVLGTTFGSPAHIQGRQGTETRFQDLQQMSYAIEQGSLLSRTQGESRNSNFRAKPSEKEPETDPETINEEGSGAGSSSDS